MADVNEVKFSGIIDRLKEINTKTGKLMATWLLKVNRDSIKYIGFSNIAESVLQCSDDDRITVTGSCSINSWKDKDEQWHNVFQVSCWEAEADGSLIKYEKNTSTKQKKQPPLMLVPNQKTINRQSEFDYAGTIWGFYNVLLKVCRCICHERWIYHAGSLATRYHAGYLSFASGCYNSVTSTRLIVLLGQ